MLSNFLIMYVSNNIAVYISLAQFPVRERGGPLRVEILALIYS